MMKAGWIFRIVIVGLVLVAGFSAEASAAGDVQQDTATVVGTAKKPTVPATSGTAYPAPVVRAGDPGAPDREIDQSSPTASPSAQPAAKATDPGAPQGKGGRSEKKSGFKWWAVALIAIVIGVAAGS